MADGWITPPDVLTEQQVAEYLQVEPRTVKHYRHGGDLVGFRVGRSFRYRLAAVEDFITRQEQKEAS